MGWIYLIRNKVNGKCYVGQTREKNVETRWRDERRKPHGILKNAFKNWGIENFAFSVICEIQNEELNNRELDEIKSRNTIAPHGYNLKPGGDNHAVHQDTKHKISISTQGEKHWNFGRKEPEDVCKRKSESLKGDKNPNFGKTTSIETKKLISSSLSGENNPNFGKIGGLHNCSKKVEQLKDGKWNIYSSISEAAEDTNSPRDGISKCCNGIRKTSGGYEWRFFQMPVDPNPATPRSVTSPVFSEGSSLTPGVIQLVRTS
jgi:group I intron endonuclease